MSNEQTILAWHFLRDDRRLRFRDGREVNDGEIVEVGQTYTADGPLGLCANGMHASVRPVDALQYAPGNVVCRVRLSGEILHGEDKLCARHREVLWMADATNTLHEFACLCAEQALERERAAGREPDQRSWDAIVAKRRWLAGEISDEDLAAAWAAAKAAAKDAAGAAAKAAAGSAAKDAAKDAAWAAAWAAAWDAAKAAAWDAQNAEFERRLTALEPTGGNV